MANAADKNACFKENLLDAGLSEKKTEQYQKMLKDKGIRQSMSPVEYRLNAA